MQIDSELLRATCGELFGSFLFLWLSLSTISLFGDDPLSIAFGFGISIAVLVYCLAEVSGGHLNFAVTFGFLIAKEIDYIRALLYLVAQLLGSTLGALAAIKGLGVSGINTVQDVGMATFGEVMGTFLLMFTVKQAVKLSKDLGPLMIGLSVFVAHLSLIGITGCSINPTRTFATSVVTGDWSYHYIFWIAPLVGSALAVVLHTLSNH